MSCTGTNKTPERRRRVSGLQGKAHRKKVSGSSDRSSAAVSPSNDQNGTPSSNLVSPIVTRVALEGLAATPGRPSRWESQSKSSGEASISTPQRELSPSPSNDFGSHQGTMDLPLKVPRRATLKLKSLRQKLSSSDFRQPRTDRKSTRLNSSHLA